VRVDRDRIGELEAAQDARPALREQHPAAVRRVDVDPHPLAVGDLAQAGQRVDGARVRRARDADDAQRPDAVGLVLRDRGLERVEAHLEAVVRRQDPEVLAPDADRVDRLVDGDVPLLGSVDRPAIAHALALRAVARHGVARELQADEVRHRPAARQVSARARAVSAQVREPAHRAPLHRDRGRPDRPHPEVLVQRRGQEVAQDPDRRRRRRDQAEVARVADVRAVRQQLLVDLAQELGGGQRLAWQRLVEQAVEIRRGDRGEQRAPFDAFEVGADRLDERVSCLPELGGVHGGVLRRPSLPGQRGVSRSTRPAR
jgi:hypothetical protein